MVGRVRDIAELPEPLPFSGIKVETVRVPRYRSTFDIVTLLESAREELATSRPEQYKILLLERWQDCEETKLICSLGLRFAGMKA